MAEKLGLSLSALQNWETNQTEPVASMIITLAEELEVSPNYLLTGETNATLDENSNRITLRESENSRSVADDEGFEWIDDCRDVIVTAGYGGINSDYLEVKKTKIEREWLRARGLKAEDCGKYKVCGDSMDDTLKDGEDIIVNHASKTLIDGKIFVLNNQGSMLIKRIQRTFSGVELISDNNAYRPIKLTAEEADSLLVIGQVVLGYRNF
ncbi:helix-turn-helix domain-containing protein [Haemophilus influenzae]|nr:S24 family peptidase [Haemophilus influenzae]MCK8905723.1 helix-turn-helix domain-containing protein [Haemophilus influenzae]MCK8945184.1 helix-turn-helix domain-containing protein [Haemophilus influenzae]MCK8970346.1 helix-turn-helix domain-containing protein [Haemophilus influenzae]MCK8975750.1 helix-turn-helix domain-containing protein [Haemophilus influenzae]MCK8989628.1 helix-turn-helix domain-containing protein [Haemophilus influenzae]